MKRGDIVTVAPRGGKPRPAVVIQSDQFIDNHASILVCYVTTFASNSPLFRIAVEPSPGNGLKTSSEIMVDKIFAIEREKIGYHVGRLDDDMIQRLDQAIMLFCGLGM